MILVKLLPILISLVPELIRGGIQITKDHVAAKRLEEERRKAERESKGGKTAQ